MRKKPEKPVITEEMIDAEIARQEANAQGGVVDMEGSKPRNLTASSLVSILAAAGAVILLIVCIPLMTSTMRGPGANCGTIFASSHTWTYSSSYDPDSSYYRVTPSDVREKTEANVEDWLADLDRGAAAYRFCETQHSDRRILLISLGSVAVVLLVVSGVVWRISRRPQPNS
ncbi:hypothetical protein NWF34_21425 [Gordonia sp. GONU]|uniref:Uncharacterized protein n=1 Tax=Gordonia amicalis TaxID=89053 RepID=A0AAE4U1S7_9ACTN|nr:MULTISPECIES: hypothetical protein [Gordonia]MCR8899502.1 hypothetical protein [Gordonia sp. GONU]MCZ0912719.1 hypothetical protein [Gordonia amicalis]MCZ4652213.1 hypothetical protein [Gordonia amicalis]MDV6308412.1 hypothetical protein [Gordonia amicalis]MDV6314284.1 hypothetical protein [Gordonia amicalis]